MANVRGFRDLNNNNNNQQQYFRMQPQFQQQQQENINMPFIYSANGDPKDENYCTMLKRAFCPRLQLFSFTVLLVIIIGIIYITMLSIGGISRTGGGLTFLLVEKSTLEEFGANCPYTVKYQGTIYQWFTSLFLVYDFLSWGFLFFYIFQKLILVTTSVFLLMFCSSIEASCGMRTTLLIYVFGGMCGALFGDSTQVCSSERLIMTEAMTGLYAVVGAYVSLVILNWEKLDALGPMKFFLMCMICMMIWFLLMFALSGSGGYEDNLGGLGGFLGGLFIGLAIINVDYPGSYERKCRLFGYGFYGFFVCLNIILVYSISCN